MVLLAQRRPRRPQGPLLLLSLPHKREIACRRLAVPLSSLHGLQQRLYMGAMEVCECVHVGVGVLGRVCSWRGAVFCQALLASQRRPPSGSWRCHTRSRAGPPRLLWCMTMKWAVTTQCLPNITRWGTLCISVQLYTAHVMLLVAACSWRPAWCDRPPLEAQPGRIGAYYQDHRVSRAADIRRPGDHVEIPLLTDEVEEGPHQGTYTQRDVVPPTCSVSNEMMPGCFPPCSPPCYSSCSLSSGMTRVRPSRLVNCLTAGRRLMWRMRCGYCPLTLPTPACASTQCGD